MKLFEVRNGYVGESYVKVFVIAEDKYEAAELAEQQYKNDDKDKLFKHHSQYWENLSVECLCEDVSQEWVSEIRDY